jgi:hypothetical protein
VGGSGCPSVRFSLQTLSRFINVPCRQRIELRKGEAYLLRSKRLNRKQLAIHKYTERGMSLLSETAAEFHLLFVGERGRVC